MAKATITQQEILDELKQAYYREDIKDDEITTKMHADNIGRSIRVAQCQLEKEVHEGRMERRETLLNRRIVIAYKKI